MAALENSEKICLQHRFEILAGHFLDRLDRPRPRCVTEVEAAKLRRGEIKHGLTCEELQTSATDAVAAPFSTMPQATTASSISLRLRALMQTLTHSLTSASAIARPYPWFRPLQCCFAVQLMILLSAVAQDYLGELPDLSLGPRAIQTVQLRFQAFINNLGLALPFVPQYLPNENAEQRIFARAVTFQLLRIRSNYLIISWSISPAR